MTFTAKLSMRVAIKQNWINHRYLRIYKNKHSCVQKCDFSSKNSKTDASNDAWIPPKNSPALNKSNYSDIEHNSKGKERAIVPKYIDLDSISMEQLIEANKKGVFPEEFADEIIETDDIDEEELMEYLELINASSDENDHHPELEEDVKDMNLGIENEYKDAIENYVDVDNDGFLGESLERKLEAFEEKMLKDKKTKSPTDTTSDMDDFIGNLSSPIKDNDVPQWLQTRDRASFKQAQQHPSANIEVKHHTLLTSKEIIDCLTALGAMDVRIIQSKYTEENLLMNGMILATGQNTPHLRTLSNAITKALKERKLAEKDVIAAKYGVEDGDDWIAIDVKNYAIHIMTDLVRRSIQLEQLWGDDEIDDVRKLDVSDEDAVDEYVLSNPIPEEYARTFQQNNENDSQEYGKYKFKAWEDEMKRKVRKDKLNKKVLSKKKKRSRPMNN